MALDAERKGSAMSRVRTGRPPATSREEIERIALELFSRRGFEETTIEDIAVAAGISRRTFFRYYASKNDVVWGQFDALLAALDEWLAATPDDVPMIDALTTAVVRFNSLPPEAVPQHRSRMSLILHVSALQAHSTLRYADWRAVIARFAARRLGEPVDALGPQLVGHVALGAAVAAYERWLHDDSADLADLLQRTFGAIEIDPDRTWGS
jgi:TetR/AcrR family transcriptional regulator, regulator of mycofactocin system